MLTATQIEARPTPTVQKRVRSLASLEQQYRAYLMQRIEDYKDSLSREELMKLGDEAATDLKGVKREQLVLTEVMMQETVDHGIMTRLRLPNFRKWRSKILPLREAQKAPSHWGISSNDPVAAVLPRMEAGDHVLVVGSGAEQAVYLLAAHDVVIQCLVGDTTAANKLEGTLAGESLSGQCEVFVVGLGNYMPPEVIGPFHLVVVDAAAVAGLAREQQRGLLLQVQQRTAPIGLHAVVSSDPQVAPEICLPHYQDWQRLSTGDRKTSAKTSQEGLRGSQEGLRGLLLSGPPIPASANLKTIR